MLWDSNNLKMITNAQSLGGDWQAKRIVMDSREIKQGDAFIAINGAQLEGRLRTSGQDGHDFVQNAIDNGAVAVIIDHEMGVDIPQLVVGNTFQALQHIANAARARVHDLTSIAITGSVGKTTMRDMISTALSRTNDKVYASQKSYNNALGVPYTLANMPKDTIYGVFEIGMNNAGEITPLSKMVEPDIGLITWISNQHIENFKNGIQGIIDAKCEIFAGMNPVVGKIILPCDNDYYDDLIAHAHDIGIQNIYNFGEKENANARLIQVELSATGSDVTADIMGEEISYRLNMPGKHMVMNSLAALLATKLSGGAINIAAKAIESMRSLDGRGAQHEIVIQDGEPPITLIDDAYNAAPVAMEKAIEVLGMSEPKGKGCRLAFLGRMAELGTEAKSSHENLAHPLIDADVDVLHCCGPDMEYLFDKIPGDMQGGHYPSAEDFLPRVQTILKPGDVVLVKGSFGSNMRIIVDHIKQMDIRGALDAA